MMKSYEQMSQNNPYSAEYVAWAKEEVSDKKKRSMMTTDTITNPDGSTTILYSQMNTKTNNDRIDGHFWIEDLNGKMVSDCGFSTYQHNLPCFKNPHRYNAETDFVVYQPCPDANMELEIIKRHLEMKLLSWGKNTCGELDSRTDEERFKSVATQMWVNRATMLSTGFDCLQNAVCEWVVRGEDKCRIRFGCAGIVRPRVDTVFWFFGHLDNTEYGEWIIKDAVSADGKYEKSVNHSRVMCIAEVPNAMKVMGERAIKQSVFNAAKELVRKRKMEKADNAADKAADALLAEWDDEEKKPKQKKQKTNNKKR